MNDNSTDNIERSFSLYLQYEKRKALNPPAEAEIYVVTSTRDEAAGWAESTEPPLMFKKETYLISQFVDKGSRLYILPHKTK